MPARSDGHRATRQLTAVSVLVASLTIPSLPALPGPTPPSSPFPTPSTLGSSPIVRCPTLPSDRSFSRKVVRYYHRTAAYLAERSRARERERERRKSISKPSNAPDATARREKRLRYATDEAIP
ncbi:hypothetical protein GW17_00042209 [Ensete ventricosum]|nr:hypothetical protein GW17_00042209 [Ensete ventricosum]